MKFKNQIIPLSLGFSFMLMTHIASAQLGGLLEKAGKIATSKASKTLGLDKLLKQPEAITTNFEDVDRKGEQLPDFQNTATYKPLQELQRNGNDGFILQAGHYEMTNKSYCLKAGTYAPSKGDGYMYTPTLGKKRELVIAILKNAEKHPDVQQTDIQMLLWTIIARTKFIDYAGSVKETAIRLLTPKQLLQLEGGALGILPFDAVNAAKEQLPASLRAVFEAENNIRNLVSSGNYSYNEFEKYAILAGMASPRTDVPSGIWTLHPDGFYIRYFPQGYSKTKVQIFVPEDLIVKQNGQQLIYDATDDISCPANNGSQRLAQTNEPALLN
ncbi:hypothetical protein LZQ00_06270 [Sphingobacterium sp. SRCM116780]|uniref:hypothetical protein n=1 Tax=Sphingobacterium sp. SRCM116780 TaxID=2907623 RepID=UPI001F34A4F1|nr:hypothetical protein [Sphingobacterium sp. SRCM116780]UIR57419.1 hypothetical protein LZQ00_06270 [Sphingobacterium sp. SRCM116780]